MLFTHWLTPMLMFRGKTIYSTVRIQPLIIALYFVVSSNLTYCLNKGAFTYQNAYDIFLCILFKFF